MKAKVDRERDTTTDIQHSIEYANTFNQLCYLEVPIVNVNVKSK
jgi:hypothetical protein